MRLDLPYLATQLQKLEVTPLCGLAYSAVHLAAGPTLPAMYSESLDVQCSEHNCTLICGRIIRIVVGTYSKGCNYCFVIFLFPPFLVTLNVKLSIVLSVPNAAAQAGD